jgi:hypothetical protein
LRVRARSKVAKNFGSCLPRLRSIWIKPLKELCNGDPEYREKVS